MGFHGSKLLGIWSTDAWNWLLKEKRPATAEKIEEKKMNLTSLSYNRSYINDATYLWLWNKFEQVQANHFILTKFKLLHYFLPLSSGSRHSRALLLPHLPIAHEQHSGSSTQLCPSPLQLPKPSPWQNELEAHPVWLLNVMRQWEFIWRPSKAHRASWSLPQELCADFLMCPIISRNNLDTLPLSPPPPRANPWMNRKV